MESYFENIKEKLLQEIEKSEFIIYAAIAWITDYNIIQVLLDKLKAGVQIELIVNNDEGFEKRKKQFDDFRSHGGRLFLYRNDDNSIMHNKFCVIDLSTIITGSFNWSFNASMKHKENIIIERDNFNESKKFAREFRKIKKASVLYDGTKTNFDIAGYAEVIRRFIYNDNENKYVQFDVVSGSKFGSVFMDMDIVHLEVSIPNKLFGYWGEKITGMDKIECKVGDRVFYEFHCIDPNFVQFVFK
jgi:PLD-like domain